jgi:imidazolonepropionase-like amidohydrolase
MTKSLTIIILILVSITGTAVCQSTNTHLSGSFRIYLLLHEIGEERYDILDSGGELTLKTKLEYSDRGTLRTTTATLRTTSNYSPLSLQVAGALPATANIQGEMAVIQEAGGNRTRRTPRNYFTIFGTSPFSLQMMMIRYWAARGRPAELPMLRYSEEAASIEIRHTGFDRVVVKGQAVELERLTVGNLGFGREVVWIDKKGNLAAAMTFAGGGLPMEAVRSEFDSVLPQLYRSGVAQQMANLKEISRQVQPEKSGAFAIVGGTLVDGTDAPPIDNSVVVVRNGRIAAVGARSKVTVPKGMLVVNAEGQTLLPGLWEMHTHFSGMEFGPALLAAGITTARDCGGEFDYLVAQRNAAETNKVVSPRLLLAGLIDAGGLKAFGHVTAETEAEARAAVIRYHNAGFQQIKLYTFLSPQVVKAISDEAHRRGMTVTGHVPQSMTPFEAVEAGLDQINHLTPVTQMLTSAAGIVDLKSSEALRAIQFLQNHKTVIDPTTGWGEMLRHSKDVAVVSFEPGIRQAPWVLRTRFHNMGTDTTVTQTQERLVRSLFIISALHKAGIPIVPGSDGGLIGHGLHRELELYVRAGLTPLQAIQSGAALLGRQRHPLDSMVWADLQCV